MVRMFSIFILMIVSFTIPASLFAQDEIPVQTDDVNSEYLKSLVHTEDSGYQTVQPGSENISGEKVESDFIKRVKEWVLNLLSKIVQWLIRHVGGIEPSAAPGSFLRLNWLVVAIVIAVIVFFVISILPVLRRGQRSEDDPDDENSVCISLSVRNALDRASELAGKSDISGALRELLTGFFMHLDETGKIPFRRSRTNREYGSMIRRKAQKQSEFASSFLPYMDSVLYAGSIPHDSDYKIYREQIEEMVSKK